MSLKYFAQKILGVLEAEGIAKVAHRLYPVANMKGMD